MYTEAIYIYGSKADAIGTKSMCTEAIYVEVKLILCGAKLMCTEAIYVEVKLILC